MRFSPQALAAVCCLSMIGCAAAAQTQGWYGGASVGMGTVKVDKNDWDDGTLIATSLDNENVTSKIIAAYRFMPALSVEGSYIKFGDAKFGGIEPGTTTTTIWKTGPVSGKAKVQGVTLQAVGTWHFKERYGLFAKGGLFMWNTTLDSNPTLSGGTLALSDDLIQNDDGVSWMYGAGADMRFRDRWHARLEWEHSEVTFANTKIRGVDFPSLGVTFDF
jgi:opacity protein-like surface antigen